MENREHESGRPDRGSGWMALLTFVVGVGMIGFSFYWAYQLFTVPPQVAVQSDESSPLKIDVTVQSLLTILVKILLLVVMAGFGSMVANRGIKLYSSRNQMGVGGVKRVRETQSETIEEEVS